VILVGIPVAIWRVAMYLSRKHPNRQAIGGWLLVIALGVVLAPVHSRLANWPDEPHAAAEPLRARSPRVE
jgi:hypothetical protein